jgi:hypothetical protein
MTVGGGLQYPGVTVLDPPVFSLYGDGRAIYTEDRKTDDMHDVQLWQAQLSSAAVEELMTYALDTAGLRAARGLYTDAAVYDAGTTTFEVHADGVDKVVSVYALGYQDINASPGPEASARAGFELLANRLSTFGSDVRAGRAQDLGSFAPLGYIIVLQTPWTEMAVNADWPWPDLSPNDFKPVGNKLANWWADPDKGEAVVRLDIASDLVAKASDGNEYVISVVPLVPAPPDYLGIEQ